MIIPGISGRIAAAASRTEVPSLAAAADASMPADQAPRVQAAGFACAALNGWVLAEDGVYCAASGNLDWFQVELADVQLKRDPAHALLRAYRQYGTDLLAQLGGRFAVCVWDAAQRIGIVAHDRFAQMSLYWTETDDHELLFAPTATAVNRLAGTAATLSTQAILHYFYFQMIPSPGTIFLDVNKLMAGHALIAKDGRWRTQRYWRPVFREDADAPMSEAAEEMLGLLSSSVGRLSSGADCGAFLSGGLDSSTVAGLLARHTKHPKTYSIGFDAQGYDEIAYAKIASERFATEFNTYYVTPDDVLRELPRIAAAYDEPFGNSSALPAFFCARLAAEDGRERLLAGDGGDELFAGNERYAKQTIFEYYGQLPSWTRQLLVEPLLFKLLPESTPALAKARSYVRQANVPLPDRLKTYNFLNRLGFEAIMADDLLATVDQELPMRLDRELYQFPDTASRLNRMLFLDWHHTLADNDLRKVNRMCELAGIQVEYPMLDDHLVEFSTRVSSDRKMRRNRLRDFYKRSVRDFLPEQIINKPKHGFGLPFGVWMEKHPGLQQLATDNLERMRRRGYLRPAFIDEIQRLHREQHAGYYGEFIWAAIMLELWLTAQGMEP